MIDLTTNQVEFDVDDGPVVDGIYPPLILLPNEAENMSVNFCRLHIYLN